METTDPYSHVHVSHISKTRRRRSQSVTLMRTDERTAANRTVMGRKEFLALLKNARLKQQDKHDEQDEDEKEFSEGECEGQSRDNTHRPAVRRIARTAMTTRSKTSMTSIDTNDNMHMTSSTTTFFQKAEQNRKHFIEAAQPKITPLEPILPSKHSYPNSAKSDNSFMESSQLLSNPFTTSSTNSISKSDTFDQEFSLANAKDDKQKGSEQNHVPKNDAKAGAKRSDATENIDLELREKQRYQPSNNNNITVATPSVNFMAAIIGIALGLIAFAFGIASLILVLLLRATVDAQLANSTSSSSSGTGTLPAACSSYTTLDDPTRNIGASGYALGCDNTPPFLNRSMPVWIRFMGTGGSTLPLQTPGMNLCGSVGTGWYNGQMPSSTGAMVNGTSCFTWYSSICQFSSRITVANCGDFYIYKLPPPPACMMRYCTI